jgi:hypothetical protein
MKAIVTLKLISLVLATHLLPSDTVPSVLIGKWSIGVPYDTPGPIGINAGQEKYIRGLHLSYTPERLRVCGKNVPIQPINMRTFTSDEFLQTYGFLPRVIGLQATPIIDLTLSSSNGITSNGMDACGDYVDPGVHVLIGGNRHVVMEVANEYFPLRKL